MRLNIKAAIEYIETNLKETIDLEACAKTAHMSLMQLYREFYSVTGHSLKDYIRKRRVSNVCFDLKYTGNSVLDIALDNGFPMSASLNKVFKRTVGVVPMEYRAQDLYYYFPSALNRGVMQKAYPVKVENIEEIPGISCSYYSENVNRIEKQALDTLMEIPDSFDHRKIPYRVFGKTLLGLDSPENCYRIFIRTERPDFFKELLKSSKFSEIGFSSIKKGPYAYITVPETDNINEAWDFLYHGWLLRSMFYCAEKVCYEEYVFYKNGKLKEMRLYLPLAKKYDSNNIAIRTEPEKHFITCQQVGPDAEAKAIKIFSRWAKSKQINNVKTYYIATQDNKYECGIPCFEPLDFPETKEIRLKVIPAGLYATYSETNFGNVSVLTSQMTQWLQSDPRYASEGESFAVYYLMGDCAKMELFIPVKKQLKTGKISMSHVAYNGGK